jgi:succinate dehydrogenase hydrophobic anchor subunit
MDVRPEPPYAEIWSGWGRRLSVGSGSLGLIMALAALVLGDDGSRGLIVGQGLLLAAIALLGPLNAWRATRLAGTILAALGAVIVVTLASTDGRSYTELVRWFYGIGLGVFTVIGVVSLWRPRRVLGDPSRVKKPLSPDAARRVFATLAVVAVVLLILVIGLIAWVVLQRAPS